jgi:FkbM family methyltransferase
MEEKLKKFICDNLKTKRAICIAGADTEKYPILFSDVFENVIAFEPNPRKFNQLVDKCSNHSNIDLRQNALFNECKDFIFTIKTNDSKQIFSTQSTTVDILNYKVDCLFLNLDTFQKEILLSAVDTIRYNTPVIILKKSLPQNEDVSDLTYNIFSYRKILDIENYHGLLHHSKL